MDAALNAGDAHRGRVRADAVARWQAPWRLRIPLVAALLWGPYCWLLFIDYPWGEYRLLWIKLWPALPGLSLPALVRMVDARIDTVNGVVLMALATAALLAASLWGSGRGRAGLALTVTLLLAYGAAMAIGTRAAFLM